MCIDMCIEDNRRVLAERASGKARACRFAPQMGLVAIALSVIVAAACHHSSKATDRAYAVPGF
jgi:hypothetical protein